MSRSKKSKAVVRRIVTSRDLAAMADREAAFGIDLIRRGFLGIETKDWDLEPWQFDLALDSLAFKELMRQLHERPGLDDLHDLGRIFEAAGRPEGRDPAAFLAEWFRDDAGNPVTPAEKGHTVEDRGDAGVWADFELAAWYAEHVCDQVEPGHICEMLY